jgi:hypothetical protein
MNDRRLSRARGVFGILVLVIALGAFGATTAAMAAGTDPDDGSSMEIAVTVPAHSITPSPSPWPPASHSASPIPRDSEDSSGSPGADGWLSGTGLGWQALVLAAAALLVTLFGVALWRGARRGAGRGA